MIDPEHPLLVEYLRQNPNSENPALLGFHFGEEELISLLTIAQNREITFHSVQLPSGELIVDLCVPCIDGEIVAGFEPDLEEYVLID